MLIIACCRLQYERTARPGALAAGKDALRLQSRVQLLDDDYMGMYQIGGLHVHACSIPATAPCLAILRRSSHTACTVGQVVCMVCMVQYTNIILEGLPCDFNHRKSQGVQCASGESKQSAVSMQARYAL